MSRFHQIQGDRWTWRRNIFLGIESSLGHLFPAQTSHTSSSRLDRNMEIYPFSIHYAVQCLEYISSLPAEMQPRNPAETEKNINRDTLNSLINEWSSWSFVQSVARQARIRSFLSNVLKLTSELEEPLFRLGFAAWSTVIHCSMRFDVDDMEKGLLEALAWGDGIIHEVQELDDDDKYGFLDVLQSFVDRQCASKRRMERALKKVVRETGYVPRYLFISGVKRHGENPIGGGGFADVWKGEVSGRLVALKVLRFFEQHAYTLERLHKDLCKESMVWRQLDHVNVIELFGVCKDEFSPRLAMVSPWMESGNILSYLKENPNSDRKHMIAGIAQGLRYLHGLEPLVIHGDLRAANILVDKAGIPKLSDFGLSRIVDSWATTVATSSFNGQGSLRWQAPELIGASHLYDEHCELTTHTDVYSFAYVCLEIFTETIPFHNLKDGMVLVEVAMHQRRPSRPGSPAPERGLDDDTWNMMMNCWEYIPRNRPTMEEIASHMQDTFEADSQDSSIHERTLGRVDVLSCTGEFCSERTRKMSAAVYENLSQIKDHLSHSATLQIILRFFLSDYLQSCDRHAMGERSVIINTGKMLMRSFGGGKRPLYPPPVLLFIGKTWTYPAFDGHNQQTLAPSVVVSTLDEHREHTSHECDVSWALPPPDNPSGPGDGFSSEGKAIGRCADNALLVFGKADVNVVAEVSSPIGLGIGHPHLIGAFPSSTIKIIGSLPERNKSVKELDSSYIITHASTVSVFTGGQSDSPSRGYLGISETDTSSSGSDSASTITGVDVEGMHQSDGFARPLHKFITRARDWDSFIIYLASPATSYSEGSKPVNGSYLQTANNLQYLVPATPLASYGSQIPIIYNQTVILECINTGIRTPLLIIRKVLSGSSVVGGGSIGDGEQTSTFCVPEGEVHGDPVTHFDEIAFEVYGSSNHEDHSEGGPGYTGSFLCHTNGDVDTQYPDSTRRWNIPVSESLPFNGSPYKKQEDGREWRNNRYEPASGYKSRAFASNTPHRRSSTSRPNIFCTSGALWHVTIQDNSVWKIVGTVQNRYNFVIPPYLNGRSILPITPIPRVFSYHVAETSGVGSEFSLTIYGENFKAHSLSVFFGPEVPLRYEFLNDNIIECEAPHGIPGEQSQILLIRDDGIIFPTSTFYTHP